MDRRSAETEQICASSAGGRVSVESASGTDGEGAGDLGGAGTVF